MGEASFRELFTSIFGHAGKPGLSLGSLADANGVQQDPSSTQPSLQLLLCLGWQGVERPCRQQHFVDAGCPRSCWILFGCINLEVGHWVLGASDKFGVSMFMCNLAARHCTHSL